MSLSTRDLSASLRVGPRSPTPALTPTSVRRVMITAEGPRRADPVLAGRGSYPAGGQGLWLLLRRNEVPSALHRITSNNRMDVADTDDEVGGGAKSTNDERKIRRLSTGHRVKPPGLSTARRRPGSGSSNERVQRDPRRTHLARTTICRPSVSRCMGGSSSALGPTGRASRQPCSSQAPAGATAVSSRRPKRPPCRRYTSQHFCRSPRRIAANTEDRCRTTLT